MKKLFLLLSLLFLTKAKAQEFVKDTTKYGHYKFETGILMPLGNLQSKIGPSQQYGFWYRTRIEHNDLLDLGFNIMVPKVQNSFVYTGKDSVFNVKAKGITIQVAFRVNKLYHFKFLQKKATIEWCSTYGASFFSFEDKENPENVSGYYADENGSYSYHIDTNTRALSCIYATQGIAFTAKNMGIAIHYNFTPYNWFTKRIDNQFGKSSLSVLLSYKL
jgi:hypothetical protein